MHGIQKFFIAINDLIDNTNVQNGMTYIISELKKTYASSKIFSDERLYKKIEKN